MTRAIAPVSGSLQPLTKRDADRLYDLVRRSSIRKEERAFVIEGPHLVERAFDEVPKNVRLLALTHDAASYHEALIKLAARNKVQCYIMSAKTAERISDTRAPQGIFAEMKMPEASSQHAKGVQVALDSIQDPGNLGTIIRTAAWFGVGSVLLSSGSVDCYNPKVLRSTQGEIFSVGIREGVDLKTECSRVKKQGAWIVAATSHQGAGSLYRMQVHENMTFVFGSEAHGVEQAVEQLADETVTIPRFGAGESLNVASSVGIILAEYMRRRKNT